MHICNPRAVGLITALLILMAASAFASKVQNPNTPADTSAQAQSEDCRYPSEEIDQDVVVTIALNDGSTPPSPLPVKQAATTRTPIEEGLKRACDIARRFIGTPYRWGGTTPKAFDCSGFTRYVYSKLGVRLPRTARQQFQAGKAIKPGQMRPGDLIFFDMMKGYVSHVGMYLGSKMFIHASTPKSGVRIDRLDRAMYKKCYIGARRYNS